MILSPYQNLHLTAPKTPFALKSKYEIYVWEETESYGHRQNLKNQYASISDNSKVKKKILPGKELCEADWEDGEVRRGSLSPNSECITSKNFSRHTGLAFCMQIHHCE